MLKKIALLGISLMCVPILSCDSVDQLNQFCDFQCAKFSQGAIDISGNVQVDGLFRAIKQFQYQTDTVRGRFSTDAFAIGDAYGVARPTLVTTAYVDAVKAAVRLEYQQKLVGGKPTVTYRPPQCSANLDVAVRASAECRAQGGCEVDIKCEKGELSMECQGECHGSCSGECTVPVCEVQLDVGASCTGECSGSCFVNVQGSCTGTCRGTCSGSCSAYNATGQCEGQCNGTCSGTCEASVDGGCQGQCRGVCRIRNNAQVNCQGKLKCEGSCSGRCTGGCKGTIKAPRCSTDANCDIEAKCEAQASAQASADIQCVPASLTYDLIFKPEVTAEGRAAFLAKQRILEARLSAIAEGFTVFDIYVNGSVEAKVDPFTTTVNGALAGVVGDARDNKLEIKAYRIPCVISAGEEALKVISDVPQDILRIKTLQISILELADLKLGVQVKTG